MGNRKIKTLHNREDNMIHCVRCWDREEDSKEAEYIYNGFGVCWGCLDWIKNHERDNPLIWKPWEMNLRIEVTKREEKTDG